LNLRRRILDVFDIHNITPTLYTHHLQIENLAERIDSREGLEWAGSTRL